MKKTFTLSHPKIKPARLAEAAIADIRKYVKRERGKALPDGVDFWDFDCRCGATEAEAAVIHVTEIPAFIAAVEGQQLGSFYVEILAKPGHRTKRPRSAGSSAEADPAT